MIFAPTGGRDMGRRDVSLVRAMDHRPVIAGSPEKFRARRVWLASVAKHYRLVLLLVWDKRPYLSKRQFCSQLLG